MPVQPPQRSRSPKRCYFLELSGELRNQIYDLVIEGRLVEIRPPTAQPQYTQQLIKGVLEIRKAPKTWRFSDILGHRRGFEDSKTKWESSLSSLVLTCRQVNREASHFLYAKTSFVFESSNRILAFLRIVRPVNKEAISRLHLVHSTYGQPTFLEHLSAKEQADSRWDRTCQALASDLKGLRNLQITLTLHDWPLTLSLQESWVTALLHFARLCLLNVKVHLRLPYGEGRNVVSFDRTSVGLDSFAETIRRKILGWEDVSALEAYYSAKTAYNKAMGKD